MKFDPNANHAMWTRETEEVFKNVIRRAQIESCCVDDHGRVDIGAIMHLLVSTYADGKYVIIPDHSDRARVIDFIKYMDDEKKLSVEHNSYSIGEKIKISDITTPRDQMEGKIIKIYKAGELDVKEIYEVDFGNNQRGQFKHNQFSIINDKTIEAVAEKIVEAKPKRSHKKKEVNIVSETVSDLDGNLIPKEE